MSDIREALRRLSKAAKVFEGGTIITLENAAQSVTELHEYYHAVAECRSLGATPYEIERAIAGEIIGGSFR